MNYLKLKISGILFMLCMGSWSCESEQGVSPDEDKLAITPEVLSQFAQLNLDATGLQSGTLENPLNGTSEQVYVLQNDINISPTELKNMLNTDGGQPKTEQYRSPQIVSGAPRVLNVLGYYSSTSSSPYFLDSKMRTALKMAVKSFNDLEMGLTFNLTTGTNTASADIVVYRITSGSAGGQSGYPSGGNPYKWLTINSGTSAFSTDVVRILITHELGHTIGLQHTDHFDRSISCGGSPGIPSPGAIHIPGTPAMTNVDLNSIMLTCFINSSTITGLSFYDSIALRTIYPPAP